MVCAGVYCCLETCFTHSWSPRPIVKPAVTGQSIPEAATLAGFRKITCGAWQALTPVGRSSNAILTWNLLLVHVASLSNAAEACTARPVLPSIFSAPGYARGKCMVRSSARERLNSQALGQMERVVKQGKWLSLEWWISTNYCHTIILSCAIYPPTTCSGNLGVAASQ